MHIDEDEVVAALRRAGARFAFLHGSTIDGNTGRAPRDLDVAAWWGADPPAAWELDLPSGVDLVVLDTAPMWMAGRVALYGRLLFEDDEVARVRWQSDVRRIWLDERPELLARQREWMEVVGRGG